MTKRRRAYPSVRALVFHQSAERFGQAYGQEAQAEFERLRAIDVPWAMRWVQRYYSKSVGGEHHVLRVLVPYRMPAKKPAPKLRDGFVPGPFPCWGLSCG